VTGSYRVIAQGSLFIAILAVVTFVDLPGDNRLMGEMQNTAHTFVFGLLSLLALALIRHTPSLRNSGTLFHYLAAGTLCLMAGIGIELIQAMIHRDADIWDVVRDGAGIVAFLGFYSLGERSSAGTQAFKLRLLIAGASLLILVAAMIPAARISYAYIERERAFPLLLDFTSSCYHHFLSTHHAQVTVVTAPREWVQAAGQSVARVTLHPGRYPGIEVADLHPDWTGFAVLSMKLYSPQNMPFPLVIRIHDRQHNFALSDRFNRRLTIMPGENIVRIPLRAIQTAPRQRKMDMQAIKAIILFAPGLKQDTTFYVSDLRLTKPATKQGKNLEGFTAFSAPAPVPG
jgi:hypothetical protein